MKSNQIFFPSDIKEVKEFMSHWGDCEISEVKDEYGRIIYEKKYEKTKSDDFFQRPRA